jgi:uncharacterized repeat protein (TIGR03833 family)
MRLDDAAEPSIQRCCPLGVTLSDGFNATPDFANDQNTQIYLQIVHLSEPAAHVAVRSLALAQLGNDVGVDEKALQSFTLRAKRRGRSKSARLPTLGIAANRLLSDVAGVPSSASSRSSRCSASAERPFLAACSLSAATTSGAMSLTMSCDIDINDSARALGVSRELCSCGLRAALDSLRARTREEMAKHKNDSPQGDPGALKHNPFAQLASKPDLVANLSNASAPATVVRRAQPAKPVKSAPCKVRLRWETKGRSGKAVVRVTGLPTETIEVIASRMRKALGCGATVEGDDLILLGSLTERAQQWLDQAGDLRAIKDDRPAPPANKLPEASVQKQAGSADSLKSGTVRSNVRRGQRVAIVLKADQDTGKLTEGIVRDLLTNSADHPRGIKVRLESGDIGRVQVIFD